MGFRRGFKAHANRIALRVRQQMGLAAAAPIDPVEMCARFDIELIALSDLECDASRFLGVERSAFSAMTVPCGLKRAIVHNDSHHAYRQRSSICHELAHCFLGHECTPPLTDDGERARDSDIEGEANFLAGVLLVTNEAALHIMRRGLVAGASEMYGVSEQMLEYRLRVSGALTIHRRSVGNGARKTSL